MLATQGKIPLDDSDEGTLSQHCIPLVADLTSALLDTIKTLQAVIAEAEQANVTEEEFQAVQSTLVATHTPLPADVAGGGDTDAIRVEERSSINLTRPNDDHLEMVLLFSYRMFIIDIFVQCLHCMWLQNVVEMDDWA